MRGKRGQKRKRRAFRRVPGHNNEMRRVGGGFPEKKSCIISIFLQLSKYEETGSSPCHPLRRPLLRHWRRAAPANRASAAFRSSHGYGGRRNPGRVGNPRLDAFPSFGKIAPGRAGGCAPRRNVLVVQRQYGRATRGAGLFIRGMLHAEPSRARRSVRANFKGIRKQP